MLRQGFRTDKAILQKVNQHLGRMSFGSHCLVNATIRDGRVTLSGNIQYEHQRRPAVKAASSVEGVRGVLDQLKISPRKVYGQ
ncbi:MAG: BON domain-containing protein [Pirellulales bacterium]|nr:BON domain-containing protein [Pirellulales bacterium]